MNTLTKINSICFFRVKDSFDVFFIKDQKLLPFKDISLDDADMLMRELEREPHKLVGLFQLDITDPLRQLELWIGCNFSLFSPNPDFVNGKRVSFTRPPCQHRDNRKCPFNFLLCDKGKLVSPEFTLTRHQVNILKALKKGLPDTQTAELLYMTPGTLRKHKVNLKSKLNLPNSYSLIRFAYQSC